MSKRRDTNAKPNGTPDHKMVDLREAGRRGVETIDLGDVAPRKPTNMNPFATVKPTQDSEPVANTAPPSGRGRPDQAVE